VAGAVLYGPMLKPYLRLAAGPVILLLSGAVVWRLLPLESPAGSAAPTLAPAVLSRYQLGVDTLLQRLDDLARTLERKEPTSAQSAFRAARFAYKRSEVLLTATTPLVSGWLNGPPAEDEDDIPRPPGVTGGFQVVEAVIFPAFEAAEADSAAALTRRMRAQLADYSARLAKMPLHAEEVLDASRVEIARVSTLGLAGFDTDQSGANVVEAAAAFEGMRALLAQLPRPDTAIDKAMAAAALYLKSHSDNERLNRLEFYIRYAAPAARAVQAARHGFPDAGRRRQRLWKLDAATVFDSNAFDPAAYNSFDTPPANARLLALGERLFFDPRLSGPGTRSCSSCHVPSQAFADGKARSPLLERGLTFRNTPTLINSAFQPVLFYDQRAGSLEAQVDSVLAHPHEMASSGTLAGERLRGDTALQRQFREAFGARPEARITSASVRLALGAYLRSLTAMNSRFDRAVRGDTLALSAMEREGFTVYMGKGRCGTCHFLPFFNGTAPPLFKSSEGEIIGVPTHPVTRLARLDPDSGRGGFDRMEIHLFAFRVPTLRNISRTAPYMHNGMYRTLDQVIDFYNRGGGAGIGADVPGQTLPKRKLNLTIRETQALIAFLKSLDDDPK
jgi:cytochrome c peroxidase